MNKETASKIINDLILSFQDNIAQYSLNSYKEAQVRKEFIDKFFLALGWDVNNDQHASERYKEVINEDSLKIAGTTKAPDYAFRIGGSRVFFVEAKAPHVNLKDNDSKEHRDAAYQLRRYAWNAKIPISILTNFEYFSIYDCRTRPFEEDKPDFARVLYINFEKYLEVFDTIWNAFAKESVLRGSFDKFVESTKGKRGTSEVDNEFLKEIEQWRTDLAKNIATGNPDLSVQELNYVVQKTIDRILFLKIAEDRNIETIDTLSEIAKKGAIYKNLLVYFDSANDKYNSGIFKQDKLLGAIRIDDNVLKEIIENLYYPKSPYDFAVLKIEILGSVYERFLGNTIRLTNSHKAKIEEKEEVRKAGGIYYTPETVVDYIVRKTVGKLIEGKAHKEIEKIRILDPACGSGTFLVRAYSFLLDYYLSYYINNVEKYKKEIYQIKENQWFLTTERRKKILLSHIFGVDIDQQAVELTKLSLLLKVLENETKETINQQLKLFRERALPDLDDNIKCGNSVVDSSYFAQTKLNNDEQNIRVNPFDWRDEKTGFGKLFKETNGAGAFDIIIGNPPYVKEYTYRQIFEDVKKTNLIKYYQGKMDFWYLFTCQAIDFLKTDGLHAFITPNNWITNAGASILRDKILNETKLLSFFDFNEFKVFKDASIQTAVFVLKKTIQKQEYDLDYYKIIDKNIAETELKNYLFTENDGGKVNHLKVKLDPTKSLGKTITFNDNFINVVLDKISKSSNYSLNENQVAQGIVCPQDYTIESHIKVLNDPRIKKGDGIFVISKEEYEQLNLTKSEKAIIKPFYTTEELNRYYGNPKNNYFVIYSDINVRKNINEYPHIKIHLDKFRKVITSDFAPYGLHRARAQRFFEGENITSLRKTSIPTFTYTNFPCYVSQTYFVIKPEGIDLKYLTGLLNSKLVNFWLEFKGKKQGNQLQIDKAPLLDLPLYKPDKLKKEELKLENKIIELVDSIIELYKKVVLSKLDSDKDLYQKNIAALENQINDAVYSLYSLKPDEVAVINSYKI